VSLALAQTLSAVPDFRKYLTGNDFLLLAQIIMNEAETRAEYVDPALAAA
jgi:hypothetical protein